MTPRQKGVNFCIITWKNRFSHHALKKTSIFDGLSRGKAGFLMTHQKCPYLMLYSVEKQFSHDTPKSVYI